MTGAQIVVQASRVGVTLALAGERIKVRGPAAARKQIAALVAADRDAIVALLADRRCACGTLLDPKRGPDRVRCFRCERVARGELATWCIACGKTAAGITGHYCDACAIDGEFLAALDDAVRYVSPRRMHV